MSSILFSLPELFEAYKKWISANPLLASDFETSVKWISYFIAGRINNSNILSELVYSLSNLLVLFNDRLITKARKLDDVKSGDYLKVWLTVLEYSEVFLELSAKKLWGEAGKWTLIIIVQGFKCISRLLLLYSHKENIIHNPPVPALKRNTVSNQTQGDNFALTDPQLSSVSFTLKRSGRTIRKVDAAPPNALRNWKPLSAPVASTNCEDLDSQSELKNLRIAETIYIFKPIVHLGSVSLLGNNTWKSWMISLLMDVVSLELYHEHRRQHPKSLTQIQRLEISRRSVALLLYLLRSPFYERHTKNRILNFLKAMSNNLPLARMICEPLAQYLPHWQSTYFYLWST